jgi:hypothetical protein
VVELDDGHGDGGNQKMSKCSTFGKKKKEKNKNMFKAKVYVIVIFVLYSRHHKGCE